MCIRGTGECEGLEAAPHPPRGMLRSVLAIPVPVRCTPCRYGNDLLSLDGRASDEHPLARERVKHSNKDIRLRALFELPPLSHPSATAATDGYLDRAPCLTTADACGRGSARPAATRRSLNEIEWSLARSRAPLSRDFREAERASRLRDFPESGRKKSRIRGWAIRGLRHGICIIPIVTTL